MPQEGGNVVFLFDDMLMVMNDWAGNGNGKETKSLSCISTNATDISFSSANSLK